MWYVFDTGFFCSIAVVIHLADFGKRHASVTRQCSQAPRADRGFQLYVTPERNRLSLNLRERDFVHAVKLVPQDKLDFDLATINR